MGQKTSIQALKTKSKYVKISIPAYFMFFDFEKQYSEYDSPCLREPKSPHPYWNITVDLDSHKVLEWTDDFGELTLNAKICDQGTYTLLDSNRNEFYTIKGYVPNCFLPEKDGFGDYLSLHINKDGFVTNWYKNPDFKEFESNGFSPIPITDIKDIRKFVYDFVRPLSQKIASGIQKTEGLTFEWHEVHNELSVKQDELTDCYPIWDDTQYDRDKDLELHIPKIKSVRIDYYGRRGIGYRQRLTNINLFTDITLNETGYYIKVLNKHCAYTDLPDLETQNDIYEVFRKEFSNAVHGDNEYVTKLLK